MIDLNKLQSIISNKNKKDQISMLICEILVLQEKLSKPDNQSFYFKQAIEKNKLKLKDLFKNYEEIKKQFNSLNIEELIEEKSLIEQKIKEIKKMSPRMVRDFGIMVLENQLRTNDDFIKIKSNFPELKSIEDYTSKELYIFFEA